MTQILRAGLLLPCLFLILSSAGGTTGCATKAASAKRDKTVDVTRYKTYQWVDQANARFLSLENPQINYLTGFSSVVQAPQIEPQLKETVTRHLKTEGYTETLGSPDFFVTYYGKAKDQDWVSTWRGRVPSLNNVPVVMYPGFDQTSPRNYEEGDLLLVFYDAQTRRPVWTGTMFGVLKGKDVDLPTVTASLGKLVDDFQAAS